MGPQSGTAHSSETLPGAVIMKSPVKTPPRYRPFGLVLAIFAAFLIYGLGPLIPLFLRLLISLRGGQAGIDIKSIIDWEAISFAAAILILCSLAWVGRPRC